MGKREGRLLACQVLSQVRGRRATAGPAGGYVCVHDHDAMVGRTMPSEICAEVCARHMGSVGLEETQRLLQCPMAPAPAFFAAPSGLRLTQGQRGKGACESDGASDSWVYVTLELPAEVLALNGRPPQHQASIQGLGRHPF